MYRTGFGWSCKLGCYYTDDPQKIKNGFIAQYKKELKEKVNKLRTIEQNNSRHKRILIYKKEILELLKNEG